ncbi:MAG: glutamate formimidoyltransferase [Pseudomonadota bacterium]
MKLVECVPNFSEGRDRAVIDAIAAAITSVDGAALLDVDPGAAAHRTVVTFVAPPEAAVEAAFRAMRVASERIDMSHHHGEHPRMGATDVCPFVPVAGVTMDECVALARQLGQRVGRELGIPVYLYEAAATRLERANLADIRRGEYEALADKLRDPAWLPDFGPAELNARSGASVIGAREFLIAFNVNLNTRDKKLAHDIALDLREQGRSARGDDGKFLRDAQGNKVAVPGLFKAVKAVGWIIDEYGCAQISMNLTDYKVSPPHLVFDRACELAWQRGLRVTGSELVGLIPKTALLEAGRYYLRKQGKSAGVGDDELVRVAVQSMGLDDVATFDPDQKIIEHRTGARDGRLVSMTGRHFAETLASDAPAPGGGSVAALAGCHAASLVAMVASLTHGKKGYEAVASEMETIAVEGHALKESLLAAVDADTAAFDAVMAAMKLPKSSDGEKKARDLALEQANKWATLVPLSTLRQCLRPAELARAVADKGNPNSLSDAGVAALMAAAGARGALYNVLINLPGVKDPSFRSTTASEARALYQQVQRTCDEVAIVVEERLAKSLMTSGEGDR